MLQFNIIELLIFCQVILDKKEEPKWLFLFLLDIISVVYFVFNLTDFKKMSEFYIQFP